MFSYRYGLTLPLLVVLSIIALSCKDRKTEQPSVEPTLVTSPLATARPPATATKAPPTPRSQATPRSSVPTPVSNLSYRFGAGVDAGDRAIISNAIEVSSKILSSYGGGEAACTILAFDTLSGLSQAYTAAAGSQGYRAASVVQRLSSGVAEAGYKTVSIYTNSRFWREADAVHRSQAVAHEYVHVVQLNLEGEKLAIANFDTPADKTPPGGPFWLLEGSAELLSWNVIEELRLGNWRAKLDEYAARAAEGNVTLQSMETYVGYVGAGQIGVATSVKGVQTLLANRPVSELFQFWRLIGAGQPWQSAFLAVFGTSVTDFYRAFEAAR